MDNWLALYTRDASFVLLVIKTYDTRRLSQWNGVANSCRDGRGNLAVTGVAPVGRRRAVQDRYAVQPISLADDSRR